VDIPAPKPRPADGPAPDAAPQVSDQPRPASHRICVLGNFRLGDKIGAGAMGAVYRAGQLTTGRPVAVKVLRPHLAKDRLFLSRFLREARALSRLSHPNIVRCYGMGKELGRHFLAMELVEGKSLGDWLYRLGRVSVGDAVRVTLAVARALQHAHQSGLVHRDVKPDNILITPEGDVKLADLGLAKGVLDEEVSATQAGHGAGTPVYMAPEQARSARQADPRSDLYALGCVLYHLLTGQFPFPADSAVEVILAKVEGRYTPAGSLDPEVPRALDEVLALLLAPHPDDRYQSASDLLNDLEELGLENAALEFLREDAEPLPPLAPPPPPSDAGEGPMRGPRTAASPLARTPATLTTAAGKQWHVLYRTVEGKWTTGELTTTQVLHALEDRHFARTAQASEHKGDYRFLGDFPEFRAALREKKILPLPEALCGPEPKPPRKRRLMLALAGLLFLGVGAAGFWLGQLLIH